MTETLETMDAFIDAMRKIAQEAKSNPELLKNAPTEAKVRRVDEVRAARQPVLRWTPGQSEG